MVSGMIHRSGIAAMFWLRWLVAADSSNAPHAAVNSQRNRSLEVGDGSGLLASGASECAAGTSGATVTAFRLLRLMAPQTSTNTKKPMDHTAVCACRLK